MGGKAILMLLLLAGALAAVLYLTDEKPAIEQTAEALVLDGRAVRDASKLRWQFRGRPGIEVGRGADGRFEVQEPIVDVMSAAHLTNIDRIWSQANMHAVPLENDEQGRAQAGLTEPELVVVVEFADGARHEVAVGAPGPLGETRFLLRDGKIWQGDDGTEALVSSLRVNVDELRERSVFRHAYGQAQELRVEQLLESGKREALHLKNVSGEWQLLAPVTGRADPVAAQRFVTGVVTLSVSHFHHSTIRSPDREPDLVLRVVGTHGEEVVELWQQEGQVYGVMPNRNHVPFTCDNNQYNQIFVNLAKELRARILVPMGESTFEELLELVVDPGQGRGERVRLVRRSQADEWQLVEPIEYGTRATPISEAAYALKLFVAQQFVTDDGGVRPRADDPRYGLGAGRWAISTRRNLERTMQTIWVGADVPQDVVPGGEPMVYVCRSDEPDNVALVKKQAFEVLTRPFTDYCSRVILDQPPGAIERVAALRPDGASRTFVRGADGWVLLGGAGGDVARPEVGDFANDNLRDLHGKAVVDMREGFGEASWVLTLARGNGDELGLLRVWDRGEDQPLLLQGRNDVAVGHEASALVSRELRALWK